MADHVLKIGILFGGRSAEHEVSIVSAQGVQGAIDGERFQAVPFGVTRQGVWLTPRESAEALGQMAPASYRSLPASSNASATIRPEVLTELTACDVAFPLIHGTQGEDGTLQGMLELLGLPYVGAGVAASALGMDKDLMKRVFRQSGLRTPEWATITASQRHAAGLSLAAEAGSRLGYPCFVKPANMGSSVGVSKAHDATELSAAIDLALRYDRKALIEQAIAGHEIEVAVLGNDEPQASPPGEIIPAGEFYDYAAKYLDDSARLVAPVELQAALDARIRRAAIAAFQAIDCAGMARVDFFVAGEDIYVNEINTIPGFTPISMYPKLWQAAGLSYRDLISRLIELALERHEKKQSCAQLSSQ